MIMKHQSIIHCTLRIIFPEVNTITKPIIIIFTGHKARIAGKNAFSHLSVATMKAENKTWKNRIHDLPISFRQLPILSMGPDADQKCTRLFFRGGNLLGIGFHFFDDFFRFFGRHLFYLINLYRSIMPMLFIVKYRKQNRKCIAKKCNVAAHLHPSLLMNVCFQ